MAALKAQLDRAAGADAPVLIEGEPGTGKETLARYLHARGSRREGPFVRIAASALPRQRAIVAFTGSEDGERVTEGVLGEARGGTLYLDGVAELEPEAQRELAAILEARSYVRAGGSAPQALDLRLVAASHKPLDAEVRAGRLREDLAYQLNVLPLSVPRLRERADDVPELLAYFAEYFAARDNLPYRRFTTAALNRLRQHGWPGNLRELRNLVQRLLILGVSGDIEPAEIEPLLAGSLAPQRAARGGSDFAIDLSLPLREARDAFERAYLGQLLKQAEGSVGKLAIMAGMERTHLYRKLRDLGIDIKNERQGGT